VETSELTFPFIDDIGGTIRGYRVFTACRTVNGKVLRLEDHLERLYRCGESIYMQPPMPKDRLRDLLIGIMRRNFDEFGPGDLRLEIIFSGGLDGETMKQSGKGAHLYVAVTRIARPPAELYEGGVALATLPHLRMLPDVKLLNYVGAIVGHQTVVPEHDAYDVLYIDPADGKTILEGSTFTIFFVDAAGTVVTHPLNGRILDSITRRILLEILEPREDIRILQRPVYTDQVSSMSEAFLASTTRDVLPVTRIDKTIIGNGDAGPVTRTVMKIFADYLKSY
jgi:branched-subunit amino acid aminotransferase/4-amino-4-deoxychorismate lyase